MNICFDFKQLWNPILPKNAFQCKTLAISSLVYQPSAIVLFLASFFVWICLQTLTNWSLARELRIWKHYVMNNTFENWNWTIGYLALLEFWLQLESHKVVNSWRHINDLLEIRSVSVLKLHFSKVEANSSLLPVRHMSCNHFGTKSFPPFFSSHCRLSLAFNAFLRFKASPGAVLAPSAPGLASEWSALVGHRSGTT